MVQLLTACTCGPVAQAGLIGAYLPVLGLQRNSLKGWRISWLPLEAYLVGARAVDELQARGQGGWMAPSGTVAGVGILCQWHHLLCLPAVTTSAVGSARTMGSADRTGRNCTIQQTTKGNGLQSKGAPTSSLMRLWPKGRRTVLVVTVALVWPGPAAWRQPGAQVACEQPCRQAPGNGRQAAC